MNISLDIILEIVNRRSGKDVRIKSREGDHPFYRGLYLVMARKYSKVPSYKLAKYAGMDNSAVYYWQNNLHGWFFTRKDLKFDYDSVEREIRFRMDLLSGVEVLDYQAEEVLNRMSA